MNAAAIARSPLLLWRTWRLIARGLDRHLESTIELMEGYDHYLRERGMTPEEDARSRYYDQSRERLRGA